MSSTNEYVKQIIQKVYKGKLTVEGAASIITVKVEDRAQVKADLYAWLKKAKYAYKDVKETRSSFNVTKLKSPEGKDITIVYKNAKSSGGSGAGAEVTELGESAQCWYTAIAFNKSIKTYDDFVTHYKSIADKCSTDASVEKIMKELPDDWVKASIKAANYMKTMPQFKSKLKQYSFHRGSSLVAKISAMFQSANTKEKVFANINKWNPADIWLVTTKGASAINAAPKDQTFASLNRLVRELYESGDAIGVSLKKADGATAHHEIFNYGNGKSLTKFKQFKVSNKSKDGYILFSYKDDPNTSIQFRSFTDTGSWQGEIKGKYAAAGKIGGGVVSAIFERVAKRQLSASNAKIITDAAKVRHKLIISGIKKFAKELGIKIDDPELQSNDWIYSKYLTLETFSVLNSLDEKTKEHVLQEIVGYAASASELSSVFIKIS